MASIQELETKVLQLERMLHFVLTSFQGVRKSPITGQPQSVSMLDMYYEKQSEAEFEAKGHGKDTKIVAN